MGRKPSDDPTTVVSVRLTRDEIGHLDQLAEILGVQRGFAVKIAIKRAWVQALRVKEKQNAKP
jgi:predicted transcriptional regulator